MEEDEDKGHEQGEKSEPTALHHSDRTKCVSQGPMQAHVQLTACGLLSFLTIITFTIRAGEAW